MLRDDITTLIETATSEVVVFSFHRDAPVECTALFEYGGEPPLHVKGSQPPATERPRLQVAVRSEREVDGRSRAEEVWRVLTGVRQTELSGTLYHYVRALNSPFRDPGGRDEEGRIRYLCNYAIEKQPG